MREFVKVMSVVLFIVGAPAAAIMWFDTNRGFTTSVAMYVCAIVAVLGIVNFIRMQLARDLAPDLLRRSVGAYFNRGGFCFQFALATDQGVCKLQVYFQNQFERACIGQIAIRPAPVGFWMKRPAFEPLVVEIDCQPAGFGVATFPIGIPAALQGQQQTFEVGALVKYPGGRGRMLRYTGGLMIRANTNFFNPYAVLLTSLGILTLRVAYYKHATFTANLPMLVAEKTPDDAESTIVTRWKLGDPPPELAATPAIKNALVAKGSRTRGF